MTSLVLKCGSTSIRVRGYSEFEVVAKAMQIVNEQWSLDSHGDYIYPPQLIEEPSHSQLSVREIQNTVSTKDAEYVVSDVHITRLAKYVHASDSDTALRQVSKSDDDWGILAEVRFYEAKRIDETTTE